MENHSNINKNPHRKYPYWIAAVFILLALSFIFDIWGYTKKVRENPLVDQRFVSKDTVRDSLEGPVLSQAGFTYHCNSCHQHLDPPEVPRELIAAHEHIKLNHGHNDQCYKCHHRTNRELLVDIYKNEISFEESELLCQKCHGTKYRDWKQGIHGRQSGYWDKTKGETTKERCTACHNPHSPEFPSMEPAPGPTRNNYITAEDLIHG